MATKSYYVIVYDLRVTNHGDTKDIFTDIGVMVGDLTFEEHCYATFYLGALAAELSKRGANVACNDDMNQIFASWTGTDNKDYRVAFRIKGRNLINGTNLFDDMKILSNTCENLFSHPCTGV